jgi:malonyl-CoA O-methyltransferase
VSLPELDQRAVRRSFDRAAAEYDKHAVLHREIGQRLLERVAFQRRRPNRILDVGCGTGNACCLLGERFAGAQVVGLDWSVPMLDRLRGGAGSAHAPGIVCADMHALPLAARSFDLVVSNLALPWSNDPERVFAHVRGVLRPGGMFLFSSFGPDTLHELREAWAAVDGETHVHRFMDMHDLGDMMVAAGFAEPVVDMEMLTLEYPDAMALLRELRAAGARNSATRRRRGLTGRGKLQRMLAEYERFRRDDRYPASYEVIYGAAFGPDEGQPVRTPEGETAIFSVETLRTARGRDGPR